jgi:copper chaperone CopZ
MNKVTLKIEGMSCSMCEAHINDVIRKVVSDAKKVESSHTKGESSFLTEQPVDFAYLKKTIKDTGYTLLSFDTQPYVKKGLFGFGR